MKPRPIRLFQGLMIASIPLGVLASLADWSALRRVASSGEIALIWAVSVAIILLFLWLILVKRSQIARWVILGIVVLGCFGAVSSMLDRMGPNPLSGILQLLNLMAQLGAVLSLFHREARPWFEKA